MVLRSMLEVSILFLFLACAVPGAGLGCDTQVSSLVAKAGSQLNISGGCAVLHCEARTVNSCAESKYPEFWET